LHDFYIVATPIGNYNDISIRSVEILKKADFIVCENENEYKKLFGRLGIKPVNFILCNIKNEKDTIELALDLLNKKKVGALISDCGTPMIEDPGFELINVIKKKKFTITSLPGANSIIVGITLAPFRIKDFYFAGFLPVKSELREKALVDILKHKETIIFMETPYRLRNTLVLLKKLVKSRKIYIPYNLTMEDEEILYGNAKEIEDLIIRKNITKGEFLIFIQNQVLKEIMHK
jgi:16S rRNA (cytidine1402-2'-O)-methyltransferase